MSSIEYRMRAIRRRLEHDSRLRETGIQIILVILAEDIGVHVVA